jgi:glycerol-3-phosphate dehydrogenase (NAD(P)+)
MSSAIAVLGGGSWGTALADLLTRRGHRVQLWAREPEVVASVNEQCRNDLFLSGVALHSSLAAVSEVAHAVDGADLIVSAAPSHAVRNVMRQARDGVRRDAVIVSVSKGLEPDTLARMSEVLAAELHSGQPIAVMSGPSFAKEVAGGEPTALVVASRSPGAADIVQEAFNSSTFRVYTHGDVIGAELGGALKNVIAIAAGILEGLGLGYNPRAALITRGLAEMARLGVAMGADPLTFAGLAGIGDLVLTATGPLSRNRSLGTEVGRGRRLEEILGERRTVAEGVGTARAAVTLGRRHGVELPIAEQVSAILFEGKSASQAIQELMERVPKPEQWR